MANRTRLKIGSWAVGLAVIVGVAVYFGNRRSAPVPTPVLQSPKAYKPHVPLDTSGFSLIMQNVPHWEPDASLETVRQAFLGVADRGLQEIDARLQSPGLPASQRTSMLLHRAMYLHSQGKPAQAYEELAKARLIIDHDEDLALSRLYSFIFMQGVSALRRGENDNCIDCRGESSCILPIAPSAVHTIPAGSRLAIKHFTEYLAQFPDDLEARWLLNVAHMTLGEHPQGVDKRYVISLDRYNTQEFDIGKFRDIGHVVGVNRLNQAGGAIMDDFDNDGRLDLMVTTWDGSSPLAFYHNKGDGTFEDRSQAAGLTEQGGGMVCYQGDYNNDGRLDFFITRGAWLRQPVRPSLLRNDGNGTFSDVTKAAGLFDPVNSNAACWADYDNDGWLDLFVACERQTNRLYHNRGNGTFEEVAAAAGVAEGPTLFSKGANWIDFDNDNYPDLFVNHLSDLARLYRNNRNGTFTDVTAAMGVTGPKIGFSCWAFDYDNDGWLDIYATCYDRSLKDVVKGLIGEPSTKEPGRLWHNVRGERFEDKTDEAGLNLVLATMGSNFADFDNDGYLDFYCGTGEPDFGTLIPNRMFKNIAGKRFAEITSSSGTGHLQKGHAVACGDWDRDGDVDLFIEMGGVVDGDRYHNILFQNPGQGNNWLGLKLVGKKTNRAAFGARIKVITAGKSPQTIQRHVSSGSSFGANPLEQTIGLAKADMVATLEIHWPTSGTTQVFHDIKANQLIEVTEFATGYRKLETRPIALPPE